MKDFDHFFADDLRNGGEFKPSNDGWQRISERLNAEGGRTNHIGKHWLIGAGILILLSMGGYICHLHLELKAIKNEIAALKTVRAGFTPAPNPYNQINPLQTEKEPDTQLISKHSHAGTRAGVNPAPTDALQTDKKTDAPSVHSHEGTRAGINQAPTDALQTDKEPDTPSVHSHEGTRAGVNPAPTIQNSPQLPSIIPHPVSSNNHAVQPEATTYPLPALTKPHKPHNWQFGLAAQVYGGRMEHDAWSAGVGIGGLARHGLTRHLTIVGDIVLSKNFYYVEEEHRFDLPIPQPPTPDYRWHGAVGRQWGAEAGLSLQYQFKPDKRHTPYVSAGLVGAYGSHVRIRHIFEHESSENRIEIEDDAVLTNDVTLLCRPAAGYSMKWYRTTWNVELFGRIAPYEKRQDELHQAGLRLHWLF